MNKNYPIYKTTFIDDMRSLVEEAAQNFPDSIAISYKENYYEKEVRKVTFTQWREDVRNLGTALISSGLRETNIAIVGENSYGWCCSFFGSSVQRYASNCNAANTQCAAGNKAA